MTRRLVPLFAIAAVALSPMAATAQAAKLRVAICARTITTGVGAPFAVAMKMGWFRQEGVDIDVVPLPGSADCVKNVATGELPVSLPSVEPLARAYAKGTVFTLNNPEAAVRIVYEVFPYNRPTGKDEATAVREDVKVLEARMPHWKLEPAGVTRWGENSFANYREYIDFLLKWGVIKQSVETNDLIANELIDDINRLDVAKIAADARAYTYSR